MYGVYIPYCISGIGVEGSVINIVVVSKTCAGGTQGGVSVATRKGLKVMI